jgi:hypothetical protein
VRNYAPWKSAVKYHPGRLADRLRVGARAAHYPPGCSKYDPIGRRFFPHVTRACRGMTFTTRELIRKERAETRTETGLRATADLLPGDYPTGEKAPDGYNSEVRIAFGEDLPAWDYPAVPRKPGS